jgi:hypothetical protein
LSDTKDLGLDEKNGNYKHTKLGLRVNLNLAVGNAYVALRLWAAGTRFAINPKGNISE